MKMKDLTTATLIAALALGASPARAQDQGVVVDRAMVEQALAQRTQSDQREREVIKALLGREDVKAIAGDLGLSVEVRRAESAVASLDGEDLHRAAFQATAAHDLLAGGASGTIQLSLVSLLLIVIIVILLAR